MQPMAALFAPTRALTIALTFLSTLPLPLSTFGQGSLTPPGIPAPTMKSLDQVEPRTAITNTGAVTISQSGSYYLTANIVVGSGNAITISANGVTLDLNGFSLISTNPSATGYGILLAGGRTNVTILNGHIAGSVIQSAGVYSGSGFDTGIGYAPTAPRNVRVTGVTVSGCQSSGIYVDTTSTIVESCTVDTVGYVGIDAQTVSDCSALNCGSYGVIGLTVQNSLATAIGVDGTGIFANFSANNCYGASTSAGSSVNNSYGLYAATAINCSGVSVNGFGLYAVNTANNCYGSSTGGRGLHAGSSANNCTGSSSSDIGLQGGYSANGCSGSSGSSTALSADTAQNCFGSTAANDAYAYAISANNALNCHGNSSGSSTAVYAYGMAENCYGSSSSGTGVTAINAVNCTGYSMGTGSGVSATTAQNCYGSSTSNRGINATTAQNCYGFSGSNIGLYAAQTAMGCYAENSTVSFTAMYVGAVANACTAKNSGGGPAITTCIAIGCASSGGAVNASCSKWLGTP